MTKIFFEIFLLDVGNISSLGDNSTTAPRDFGSSIDPVITSDPPEPSSINLTVDLFPYFPSAVSNVSSSSDNSTTTSHDTRSSMDPVIKSDPPKTSSTFDVYHSNKVRSPLVHLSNYDCFYLLIFLISLIVIVRLILILFGSKLCLKNLIPFTKLIHRI
ncbi:unnamed protein product [Ilex paraguariensis]|uniref:Uncharacterized protein n=1 Tax=Ilex paraguariensis TaxID=185542 RepID=A0ABC8S116_9AQUA